LMKTLYFSIHTSQILYTERNAFFVDTPTFRLNPLFGEQEDYVFISDPKRPEGFRPRRVLETTWGVLKKRELLMRLYIHDNHRENEQQIVEAFTQRQAETHI